MSNAKTNQVPPDGGYGWVITFAYALNNVVVLPLISGFALVFQEAFEETGLSASQGTLVIILHHGLGMLMSFFGGPALCRFGYRKVAVFGAILVSSGLLLTAVANNLWFCIISYGIINATGIAAVMAAFNLAINSFFREKRTKAIGVGMFITGIGATCMPLIMSALLYAYGWRYAIVILSAICLHSLLAACLLRPAKWYLKAPPLTEEAIPLNQNRDLEIVNNSTTASTKQGDLENLHKESTDTNLPVSAQKHAHVNNENLATKDAVTETPDASLAKPNTQSESEEINLESSIKILNGTKESSTLYNNVPNLVQNSRQEEKTKTSLKKLIDFFDLTLLCDPTFVNILLGLSIASCVEINFSLLLPIILKDMLQFQTTDIAKLMAVIGFSDTSFRLLSPFIGECCHKSPRMMYMVNLILIIFTRTLMLFTTSFSGMLFVTFAMGMTKGVRTVYTNVVIPSYVPLERLPFASGIQMFVNGIVVIIIGTLLGSVRDTSGSYRMPIIILNFVTLICIISWTAEFIYCKVKDKQTTT